MWIARVHIGGRGYIGSIEMFIYTSIHFKLKETVNVGRISREQ